jgi:hypothetical protein
VKRISIRDWGKGKGCEVEMESAESGGSVMYIYVGSELLRHCLEFLGKITWWVVHLRCGFIWLGKDC